MYLKELKSLKYKYKGYECNHCKAIFVLDSKDRFLKNLISGTYSGLDLGDFQL